jgi:signal transduction histidine kinase
MNAVVYLLCGLVVWVLRPHSPLARSFLVFGVVWSTFFLTAMDLYGPGTFTRLHTLAEALTGAAVFQFALLFPQPHGWARWRFIGYLPAAALAIAYARFFHDPARFSAVVMVNMLYLGAAGVFLGFRLIDSYRSTTSQLARQRVRIMALGTLFGLALPGAVLAATAAAWGSVEMNFVVFSTPLFVAATAYAIVKHDLFEIDAMVKRGAYYLVLTGAVGTAYVLAVVVFNAFLPHWVTASAAFPIVFTLAVLLVFNPLRGRLQAFVDSVFFRTRYNSAQLLATLAGELSSAITPARISDLVVDTVQRAIPNTGTRLFVQGADHDLSDARGNRTVAPPLHRALAAMRVVTAFDPLELYSSERDLASIRVALEENGAEIAIPVELEGQLVGALTAGTKRSGLFYTAGDSEFLRAVSHQAAIALANASKYDELVRLNASLEERVRDRTAQLEKANRDLAETYRELQAAEVHLVHSEKMAALGRLVAGVAHEINNPVSFISTSVAPLKRRLDRASTLSPPEVAKVLAEAHEVVDLIGRGAERTAAIVRDLRSFSRLGETERKPVDLTEGIEVSLRLLAGRLRDKVTVHRQFADLPLVECDPGQINQVFMNILANACDAAPSGGNIWVTTKLEEDFVVVTVRDDGPGISPDLQRRIFDPFFTTKDVGHGTGLGLAIAQSVVSAHDGRLEVASTVGKGATFTVTLPVTAPALAVAKSAGSGS